MLAELRTWVAGLITLIFFATILEMLLPTSAMRRFVRLVISLVLIMVLMKPVFKVME
ncbi:MAG: stage III sporulation protein AF, partial [Bacillota bacterium]